MTKRQLVKWLEAKQNDAKAEVEIQYATAEKAYFAQRDEALKINETVDEVFRLISEADTVASRWKEALEKVEGIDTTRGWYTSLTTKLGDVAWYLAVTAHAIGYDLETVLQMNVDKLRNRYPNGFEKERSLHRQEGDV